MSASRGKESFAKDKFRDFKRKRKLKESEQDRYDNKDAKHQKRQEFTEIEFKFLLRNSNTVSSGFEKFVEAAEKWPTKTRYDIVAGFLCSSPECAEIFQILEAGKRKVQELQLIFQCFEKLLLRIAEDLDKYFTTGQHIVKKLLSTQLSSIYFSLSVRNKSSQIKMALKLLVAMVMLGPSAGKTVLSQIDLNHANIKPLFFRRDSKAEEDVRTCLLHLIVAVLLAGDNELIRKLADTKGFLANVFQGIVFDRVATIQLVLSTFLEKIILNPVISKTSKVHIFTESSLKQLGQLYSWKGPSKWKDKSQEKTEEGIEEEMDVMIDKDKQTVAEIAHKFLTELCSSYKFGINFVDKAYGTSTRNQNHILTGFLNYLSTISQNTLAQELITKILVASPDQLRHFLPQMAHSLSPRATQKWVDTVRFLCKIYEAQPDEPHILKSRDHIPVNQLVNILLVYTLPPLQILNAVLPGVKNKSIAISHMSLSLVKVIAQQSVNILRGLNGTDCVLRTVYSVEEVADIATSFKDAVTKSLPENLEIFQCLDRLQLVLKNETSEQLQELADLCQVRPSDHMMKIEQVLCFYQDLTPTLLLDHPLGLVKLLEGVGSQNEAFDLTENEAEREAMSRTLTETELLPQLYLLKLLSGTDARRLPWGKEGQSGHTLMYQLLSMVAQGQQNSGIKKISLQLICKLLVSTGLFDTFSDEIYIWMKHLQALVLDNQNSSDLLTFVSKIFMVYIANPYPYMDRVSDFMSEAIGLETGIADNDTGKEKLDRKIEEILSMDLDSLEDKGENTSAYQLEAKRHPFCPVLLVAVDHIQKLDRNTIDAKNYLSSVILDVFHSQTDPKALCLLVKQTPESFLVDGLQAFVKTWLPPYKMKKPQKQLLSIPDRFQGYLMQYLLGSEPDISKLFELENVDKTLTLRQCLLYTKLLLEKGQTEEDRSKLSHILELLIKILTPELADIQTAAVDGKMDDTTLLPVEFSELEIKKASQREELESLYRILFEHPAIKSWFLSDVDEKSTEMRNDTIKAASAVISVFVERLLVYVKSVGIGGNLKEELNFYIDKVLKCINQEMTGSSKNTRLVMKLLLSLLNFLDFEKSHGVLNTILDIDKGSLQVDDSVIGIAKQLVLNLIAQDSLSLKLSENCVQNLVSLTSRIEDSELLDHVVCLLKKFSYLSILCSKQNVIELLENSVDTRLVEIMISNSVELWKCVEAWFIDTETLNEHKKQLMPLVLTFLHFETDSAAVIGHLESVYQPDIMRLCHNGPLDDTEAKSLIEMLRHFIRVKAVGKKTIKKLEKKLTSVLESDTPMNVHHIQVIQMILGCQATETASHDQGSRRNLHRFCVQALAKVVKDKENRRLVVAKEILGVLDTFSKDEVKDLCSQWKDLREIWPNLLKGCLKYLYLESAAMKFLTHVLPSIYESGVDVSVSIDTIVTMVMSHSSFLPVMFNEESLESKEPLLDLVIQLVTLNPDSCEKDHIGIYLGSYGATLSMSDQKLLKLMHIYEKNGIDLSEFRPFLWGEKAIEYHTMRKSMGPSLLQQPTMVQILTSLHLERMAKTVKYFPLRRQLQSLELEEATEYKSLSDCYDPCFFIPLFSHLLAPAAVVDCRRFIENDCLGMMFAALSSHDQSMRSAAYHIIERFNSHLEAAKFMEMDQILYILGLLKNSVAVSRCKLACIVTIFLARAVRIMLKPEDHMYGLLNAFLLLKPSLDVVNVPEFYKLFNSSALEYKAERQWILSLLFDGLRETADYRIFEKRYTFKLLQSFYDSDLSDTPTQVKVLQILHSACKERTVVVDLTRYHSFMTWLSGAVRNLKPDMVEQVSHLVNIVNSLWFTFLGKKSYQEKGSNLDEEKREVTDKVDEDTGKEKEETVRKQMFVQPSVTSQVLMVLQAMLWRMRDVWEITIQTYIDTVLSVIDHLQFTLTCLEEDHEKLILSTISSVDILLLLLYSEKIIPTQNSSKIIMKILTEMGYDGSVLMPSKGVNLKGGNSSRKKNTPHDSSLIQSKPEKMQINVNQDADKEADQRVPSNEEEKELGVKGIEQKDEIVSSYTAKLIKIITASKHKLDDNAAHILAIMSWCLEKSKHIGDTKVLNALIKWICSYTDISNLVVHTIASKSAISKDILERLLNLYVFVSDMRVKGGDSDYQVHDSILKDLNAVLEKVAAAKLKIPEENLDKLYSKLRKCITIGKCPGTTDEVNSLLLRKFFLAANEDKERGLSRGNEEFIDDDSSSRMTSEEVESQKLKITPKTKAKSKSPKTKLKARRSSQNIPHC